MQYGVSDISLLDWANGLPMINGNGVPQKPSDDEGQTDSETIKNIKPGAKVSEMISFYYLLDQDGAQYLWLDPFGHAAGMVFDARINQFIVGSKGGTMSSN